MRKKIDCAETECCDCIEIHGECIKKVIERMPAEVTLIDLAALFKVFGDPTRVKLLYVLIQSELCVCDLAEVLHMTQSAISHQLRILKQMKLVKSRREGKTVFLLSGGRSYPDDTKPGHGACDGVAGDSEKEKGDRKMKKRFGLVAAGLLALTMAGCSTQIEKGTSLLKEEKYEEAAEVFEKASGKSSMEREAYRGLGISYFELGQYDKAASAFETALEKGVKKTPELYNLLGISYMKIGQYDKAAVSFENGSQMDGAGDQLKREMAYNEIFVLEKAGDYTKAKERADAYLQTWPDDEDVKKEAEFLETQAGNA